MDSQTPIDIRLESVLNSTPSLTIDQRNAQYPSTGDGQALELTQFAEQPKSNNVVAAEPPTQGSYAQLEADSTVITRGSKLLGDHAFASDAYVSTCTPYPSQNGQQNSVTPQGSAPNSARNEVPLQPVGQQSQYTPPTASSLPPLPPLPPTQQSVASSGVQGSLPGPTLDSVISILDHVIDHDIPLQQESQNLTTPQISTPQQGHTLQPQPLSSQFQGQQLPGNYGQQFQRAYTAPIPEQNEFGQLGQLNQQVYGSPGEQIESKLHALGATPNTIGEVNMPNLRKRMNPSKFCWCYPMDNANQWMFVISCVGALFAFICGCISMWGAAYMMPNCAMLILVGILAFKTDRHNCPHTRQTLCFALMLVNFVSALLCCGWIFWAFGIFCHTVGDWNADASISFISLFWYGCWIPVHIHWLGVANAWRESHGGAAITDVVIGTAMVGKRWEQLAQDQAGAIPEGAQSFKQIYQNTVGVHVQDLNEWRKNRASDNLAEDDKYGDHNSQNFHQPSFVDLYNKIHKNKAGGEDGSTYGLHEGFPVGTTFTLLSSL